MFVCVCVLAIIWIFVSPQNSEPPKVGLDHCNKIPHTRQHVNNRNLLFTVLEARNLRAGGQLGQVRALYPGHGPSESSMVGKIRVPYEVSWALIPFIRASSSWLNCLPKVSPTDTITFGRQEFCGDTNIHITANTHTHTHTHTHSYWNTHVGSHT